MHQRRIALASLLAAILILTGCSVSPTRIQRADAAVAGSTQHQVVCDQADRCAISSPLLDAAHAAMADSTDAQPVHVVTLLNDSEAAMVARLNLIRAAQHSIDVQTYIWDQDDAGQLVLNELLQAARRGVKVRILADQLFSFGNPGLLDRLATAHANLEVRLYNPTFHESQTSAVEFSVGVVCCFMKFNQRMHNKLLLVDDTIGITGGRNYQDRYFDWDDDFDYVDRDVMVGGPAARAMAASFETFWKHKRAAPLTHLRDINRDLLGNHPPTPWPAPHYAHPQRVARVLEEAEDGDWLDDALVSETLRTGRVDYFSDLPAKTKQPDKRSAQEFTAHVMHMISSAQHEVILQTPYLVLSDQAQAIFARLRQAPAPPRIVVSTNSLASTDAFAVYAISYKHRKRYLEEDGFEIYEMKPRAAGPVEDNAEAADDEGPSSSTSPGSKARRRMGTERGLLGSHGDARRNRPAPLTTPGRRFGLHAKSIVVDDDFAMVGSHNFDPRSDHYNTEAGVIVYDARFASELRASILRDTQPENAWVVGPRQRSGMSEAIGDVSASLPVFDLWPYRYATSYDLKAGCTPMRPTDPGFFSCYTPVGDFPDVNISSKLIYTRLITAFGSGAKGIL
ncbi:phospholipase D-like domain-containing protein [Dyella soli]|uniref:Phosphatidylserine/phosphatidylglycerophosphate/ cardiolipin synthase family protein n=1 Tax=Dyella soli TaxID=522319 RepID=A0A4R0YT52_9GAMM|nr:phosphatidylserine/phosphatidylglycerophosphate/cardiolipin synthase family protein [Dyella soli]TCI09152.1 phosphatidylserine/phosphatidylglycerophosphate/cardiolipin synthase family protein [Dyella soli]